MKILKIILSKLATELIDQEYLFNLLYNTEILKIILLTFLYLDYYQYASLLYYPVGDPLKKNQIISVILIIFLTTLLFSTTIVVSYKKPVTSSTSCYGFIIPIHAESFSSKETVQNDHIKHLINDLLRENITIYWSSSASTVPVFSLNSLYKYQMGIKKGDFIIPFSNNKSKDIRLTTILFDYNKTNEIQPNQSNTTSVYLIGEPIKCNAFVLNEAKIAQHLGEPVRHGWPCYLQIAEAGGFFTMEFFIDNEASLYLTNDRFNVFMWPYNPNGSNYYEVLKTMSKNEDCNAIREFVKNGGGFIGSCYGANVGSSGLIKPIPIFSLSNYYNDGRNCSVNLAGFSLSDTLMGADFFPKRPLYVSTVQITDTNHPLSYGVNTTFIDFFNGAWFEWLGPESNEISSFQKITGENDSLSDQLFFQKVNNSPSWVESHFGNGTIILFADHPEFMNNISLLSSIYPDHIDRLHGRRVIHNSLFFVTSESSHERNIYNVYPFSFLQEIEDKTTSMNLNFTENIHFKNETIQLTKLKTRFHDFYIGIKEFSHHYQEKINDTYLFRDSSLYHLIYLTHYSTIFINYIDKTLHNLSTLNLVLSESKQLNQSFSDQIRTLKEEIHNRINSANELLSRVVSIAQKLQKELKNQRTTIGLMVIFQHVRELLKTFEIELKYIPQLHFETVKLLRSCWYTYETSTILN